MFSTIMRWWTAMPLDVLRGAIGFVTLIGAVACSRSSHPPGKGYDMYNRSVGPGGKHGVLHLRATWSEPWCGGMEPEPGVWPRTTPWRGRMYIRAAKPDSTGRFAINDVDLPIFDTIRTDGSGNGYLALPPGHYLVLDRDRVDRARHDQILRDFARPTPHQDAVNKDCLKQWLHGPFGVIRIAARDTLHLDLPLHGQCPWYSNPCVNYRGPLPP